MKKIITIAMLLLAQSAMAIQFEVGKKQDPLEVTIVDKVEYGTQTDYLNQEGRVRLIGRVERGRLSVEYVTSLGGLTGRQDIGWIQGKKAMDLFLALDSASKTCPVTLTISRNTYEIEKVKTACDFLAEVESEANAG